MVEIDVAITVSQLQALIKETLCGRSHAPIDAMRIPIPTLMFAPFGSIQCTLHPSLRHFTVYGVSGAKWAISAITHGAHTQTQRRQESQY